MKDQEKASRDFTRVLVAYATLTLTITLFATHFLYRAHPFTDLFRLSFFVGPGAQSLLDHHNLSVYGMTGTPRNYLVFRSGRMPIAATYIAICSRIFGRHAVLRTSFLKSVLCWMLLLAAAYPALAPWRNLPKRIWLCFALLLLPFLMPAFLADLTNLQVEEGYSFALLALATSFLLFEPHLLSSRRAWVWAALLGLVLDLLYLSKSSMLGAVLVLAAAAFVHLRGWESKLLLLALIITAPLSWSAYQHKVGGRWTIGTSLDQVNFHKGNNEFFLINYPPKKGHTLDDYDAEVNHHQFFTDEWTYSDWHEQAARRFIRTHPKETAIAVWRKFYVFFFTLVPYGAGSHIPGPASVLGILLFRCVFWCALAISILKVFRFGPRFRDALLFLALVCVCALPYLAGFAYIRHASILIFPSSLVLCSLLSASTLPKSSRQIRREKTLSVRPAAGTRP